MQASRTASNWDFTSVIELLYKPAALPAARTESIESDGSLSSRPAETQTQPRNIPLKDGNSRRLGDFGPVWGFLHDLPSRIPETATSTLHGHEDAPTTAVEKTPSRAAQQTISPATVKSPKPKTILQRPARRKNVSKTGSDTLQNASGSALSDSTTAPESDGDSSIFDSQDSSRPAFTLALPQAGAAESSTPLTTPPSSCEEDYPLSFKNYCKLQKHSVQYKSAAEQRASLLYKLTKDFSDFAGHRLKNLLLGTEGSTEVHVFVDVSNISIGFHSSYKVAHGIPLTTHIRRLPLSFRNLSLILERGRPAAKRVLAGSDRFPEIKDAEKIGYEVNILDRVHKVKHLTPRQLKYRNALGNNGHPGQQVETNTSPPERWVEQGVDEILHLKMMESLVDAETPATIVLATGDAAEAEYSGGFLKMVERALQRGWNVELVSFDITTSHAYKRKAFREKWGAQFKIINLEKYIDELLDIRAQPYRTADP